MTLLISFAALFMSIALVQLSSGALGPLDVLGGLQEGFSKSQIGLLGSAHFAGFFVGCWSAPRLIGTVGHSRAFAAFAALGVIGAIAHPLLIDPVAWAGFRVFSGISVAGAYTVVEAWLQAKVTNDTRGRVLGVYRVVDLGASVVAQLMIAFLEPASYISYNIIAILGCLCLLPLLVTRQTAPTTSKAPRLRPIRALRLSPLGAFGVIVAGVTMPAFRMVGPLYGSEAGLRPDQIGIFLAAAMIGGAVAQIPAGWLADRYDRRHVLIGLSLFAAGTCAWIGLSDAGFGLIYVTSFLFGVFAYPIFSISIAHANDFSKPENAAELSASLMFLYGFGAIASPYLAAILIERDGPGALFLFLGAAHVGLIAFSLVRMRARATMAERTAYAYTPRTSFILHRLLRRR